MDNLDELYITLENASYKIQALLNIRQLDHSSNILRLRQEALDERLYALDMEAIRNGTDNLALVYKRASRLQKNVISIIHEIEKADDLIHNLAKIVFQIDKVLEQINKCFFEKSDSKSKLDFCL